ncbi:hypothetical protein R1sor_014664 [Riccia sorocarpa]|uniref:Uncharacterized protein n=1 Tax=Riccia sorocarpa TaxID=122646 RepID=A0ABD3HDV3_9MARC
MAARYPSGTRVHDSLYSLYKPPDPNAAFVFFDGIEHEACVNMHIKAWDDEFRDLLAKNLAQELISYGNISQVGLPIVLIGYDLRGLVLKALCDYLDSEPVDVKRRGVFGVFLKNLRGISYFSTPHQRTQSGEGSDLDGELVEYVKLLNAKTAQMNGKFQNIRKERKWKTGRVGHLLKD